MPFNVERFDYSVPRDFAAKQFNHRLGTDDYVWLTALDIWSGKASRLIERLLSKYVQTPTIIPPNGNATA